MCGMARVLPTASPHHRKSLSWRGAWFTFFSGPGMLQPAFQPSVLNLQTGEAWMLCLKTCLQLSRTAVVAQSVGLHLSRDAAHSSRQHRGSLEQPGQLRGGSRAIQPAAWQATQAALSLPAVSLGFDSCRQTQH